MKVATPAAGRRAERAGKRGRSGVVRQRDRDAAVERRIDGAEIIFGLDRDGERGSGRNGRRRRRFDDQVRGDAQRGHVEGADRCRGQSAAGSPKAGSPAAVLFSARPEKTARPLAAERVVVPPRVLLPGFVASATLTLPVKLVARFPSASSALAVNPKGAPTVTFFGNAEVMTNCVGAPGMTLMLLLVADGERRAREAERVARADFVERQAGENGHAAGGAGGRRSCQGAAAGIVRQAAVTLPEKPVATFPSASSAVTVKPKPVAGRDS